MICRTCLHWKRKHGDVGCCYAWHVGTDAGDTCGRWEAKVAR